MSLTSENRDINKDKVKHMRIAGITVPDTKHLEYALTAVHGVGLSRSREILSDLNISFVKFPTDLSVDEENAIREKIESFAIEGELKREVSGNIKRLKDIKSYRGMRHARRLPARGQRTKTNARTLKGVKKTMGSGRRKLEKT